MNRKITRFTVYYIIILLAACNPEKELEPSFLETMEKTELKVETRLSRSLEQFFDSNSNSRMASSNFGTLDLSQIFKRVENENQIYPNFTIKLTPPNPQETVKEHLVLIGVAEGYRAYIIQKEISTESQDEFWESETYTGYIRILNLNREILAVNYFQDGIDAPIPSNNQSRNNDSYYNCQCKYEYKIINLNVHAGLNADYELEIVGIVCDCEVMGGGDGTGGGEPIGDIIKDPEFDGTNDPGHTGGGGSSSNEDEDNIGVMYEKDCGEGYIKNSEDICEIDMEYFSSLFRDQIDNETNPDEKRMLQLQYIATHNAQDGRDFKTNIESLLSASGITVGEVSDINEIVNNYWKELVGRLIIANFYPVVETAKPFVELALIETGSGVLFHAVKGLLSIKWGIQLSKIGINTTSITTIVNRMKAGLVFSGRGNNSLSLKIGGRNLLGLKNSNGVYKFSNMSNIEAKAIFDDMVTGREIKTITKDGNVIKKLHLENGNYIQMRKVSSSQNGEITIDIFMEEFNHLRGGKFIELKFNL